MSAGGSRGIPPEPVPCGGGAGSPVGRGRQGAGHDDPGFRDYVPLLQRVVDNSGRA